MRQRKLAPFAVAGAFALLTASIAQAQTGGGGLPSKPRSSDERVVDGQPTPPPVNSVYRKAAEGQLPGTATPAGGQVPSPGGAIDPASRLAPGAIRPETGDPAVRLQPAVVPPGASLAGQAPAGMGVAMLIEHAVGMAIESSALQAIAEQGPANADAASPSKILLDHARKGMAESKALLTQAAADGRAVDAASPTRRFYAAANNYLTTLGALSTPTTPPSPADKAQVALINHSVKEVLDAGHIRQFGRAYSSSAATEQLVNHAREMREGGMQTVLRIAGNGTADAAAPASPALLAQRGRELIDAAEQLSNVAAMPGRMAPPAGGLANDPAALLPNDPNPGRLKETRTEIIGGTQATGSQSVGTAPPNATVTIPNATGTNTDPRTSRPTGGQAGPRPR